MESIRQIFEGRLYDHDDELPPTEAELLREARVALTRAYAPYSQFRVGAALRLSDHRIITGNNQENAAFPSGLCAERVAFFSASALYPGHTIEAVAIVAATQRFDMNQPVAPCGACRQVMLEYEMNQNQPITVILQGETGKILRIEGVRQLLPFFFHESGLRSGDEY